MTEFPRIYRASVTKSRRTERISIASSSDFVLAALHEFWDRAGKVLPYCLDPLRRRSLYVADADVRAASEAPFYYLHLRRTARTILAVPWRAGRITAPSDAAPPILAFSPGRVGSTLLSAMLFEAGIANVSEPDFYTQMTRQFAASPFNPLREQMRAAVLSMGRDLSAAFGSDGPVVAKLRAECCRAPWLILEQGRPKTLFMTRRFEPWARSTGRVFRAGPKRAVAKYLQSLRALDWLERNTQCHVVLYDSLVSDTAAACSALGTFLGREISADAAKRALERDSQEGTPLEQGARLARADADEVLAATLALWRSDKLLRLRAALPLYDEN